MKAAAGDEPAVFRRNAAMEKDRNQDNPEKFSDRLNDFIGRHRKAILGVFIAIIVAVIVACVALVLVHRSAEARVNALDDLEGQYALLSMMDSGSAGYADAVSSFRLGAEDIIAEGIDDYAGAKAQYLLADLAFAEKDWTAAAAYYSGIAAAQSDTYLAPLSLMNEAVCYENLGDNEKALSLYTQVIDTYGEDCAYAPKAMFSMGRLYVGMGEMELAEAEFETLTGLYLAPANGGSPSEYARMAEAFLINFAE